MTMDVSNLRSCLRSILMLFTQSWFFMPFMPKPFSQHLNNGSPRLGSEAVVSEASPEKTEKVKRGRLLGFVSPQRRFPISAMKCLV